MHLRASKSKIFAWINRQSTSGWLVVGFLAKILNQTTENNGLDSVTKTMAFFVLKWLNIESMHTTIEKNLKNLLCLVENPIRMKRLIVLSVWVTTFSSTFKTPISWKRTHAQQVLSFHRRHPSNQAGSRFQILFGRFKPFALARQKWNYKRKLFFPASFKKWISRNLPTRNCTRNDQRNVVRQIPFYIKNTWTRTAKSIQISDSFKDPGKSRGLSFSRIERKI